MNAARKVEKSLKNKNKQNPAVADTIQTANPRVNIVSRNFKILSWQIRVHLARGTAMHPQTNLHQGTTADKTSFFFKS